MSYLVIARKYRPRRFEEVVGQPAIARTLKNAIELGRVAHAYLFAGPRGVGKTSLARILARALCCEKGPTAAPCDVCERCQSILKGNDLDVVEIDAASNRGIDDIRSLRDKARVMPMRGKTKMYIIDEVHQLTSEAFNALLKTLEEPPEHVLFVLATTEPERIPDTIRSRCQCFEFGRVPESQIVARLAEICAQEGIEVDPDALDVVARAAKGGMRDSQSLLDQLITFSGGRITVENAQAVTGSLSATAVARLLGAAVAGDLTAVLSEVERLYTSGVAPEMVIDALLVEMRDLMVVCAAGVDAEVAKDASAFVRQQAATLDVDRALAMTNMLLHGKRRIAEHDEPRLPLEATLLRVARLARALPIAEAIEVLRRAPADRGPSGPTGPARPAAATRPVASPARPAAPATPSPSTQSARRPDPSPPSTPSAQASAPDRSEAQAAPPAPAGSSPPPAADPNQVWLSLLVGIKARSAPLGAFLTKMKATSFENRVLHLSGSSGAGIYNLDDPRVRRMIQEAAEEHLGYAIELQVAKADPVAQPKSRSVVDRAREMFDGQMIE